MLCFHCLLKISEPTLPGVCKQFALRSSYKIGYFYTSRRSKYQGNNITSEEINSCFPYRKRDTFACLPTGYGKSLIFQVLFQKRVQCVNSSNSHQMKGNLHSAYCGIQITTKPYTEQSFDSASLSKNIFSKPRPPQQSKIAQSMCKRFSFMVR